MAVLEEVEVEEEGGYHLFTLAPLISVHPTTVPSPWATKETLTPNKEEGEEEGEARRGGARIILSWRCRS